MGGATVSVVQTPVPMGVARWPREGPVPKPGAADAADSLPLRFLAWVPGKSVFCHAPSGVTGPVQRRRLGLVGVCFPCPSSAVPACLGSSVQTACTPMAWGKC